MNTGTPIFLFEGDDIDKLYRDTTKAIMEHGVDIVFGYEHKKAREACVTIKFGEKATVKMTNGVTPKGFVWGGQKLKEFRALAIAENTNPYDNEYTYQQLLREWPNGEETVNQLDNMRTQLNKSIEGGYLDNGIVGVLFDPNMWESDEKPCFNWMQIRHLGDRKISLRLLFRSHDYGSALWANLPFILHMVRRYIAVPNNCKVVEVILHSESAHIYEGDQDNATKVAGIPWLRPVKTSLTEKLCGALRATKED
jgi:thymidylate synthase